MPTNRPTAIELLQAVRECLHTEILPLLSGNERYHLQVSLNALGILERELATGARIDDAERQRLSSLLGVSDTLEQMNRLLGVRIRDGLLSYRDRQLMDHLVRTAMDKMSIDNPKYASYVRALTASRGASVPGDAAKMAE
jgi:hypothetical protein